MTTHPIAPGVDFDWDVNNAEHLKERASALEAFDHDKRVQKFDGEKWIDITEQTAFFFERRYRARP